MPIVPRDTNLPLLTRQPGTFIRRYRAALLVLLIGASLDLLTTFINMRRYGPSVEAHPVQRIVSEMIGVTAGVPMAKLIQLGFVLFVAAWWRPWCAWVLGICGILYSLAAVSNHLLLI
jgi:hypothetical protein